MRWQRAFRVNLQIECLVNLQCKAFVDKCKGFAEFAFLHTQAFAEFTADFVFVRTLLLVFMCFGC